MDLFISLSAEFTDLPQMLRVFAELLEMSYPCHLSIILTLFLILSWPAQHLHISVFSCAGFILIFLSLLYFLHINVLLKCYFRRLHLVIKWNTIAILVRNCILLWSVELILSIIESLHILIITFDAFLWFDFACKSYFIELIRHWWSCSSMHSFPHLRLLKQTSW